MIFGFSWHVVCAFRCECVCVVGERDEKCFKEAVKYNTLLRRRIKKGVCFEKEGNSGYFWERINPNILATWLGRNRSTDPLWKRRWYMFNWVRISSSGSTCEILVLLVRTAESSLRLILSNTNWSNNIWQPSWAPHQMINQYVDKNMKKTSAFKCVRA